MKSIPEYAKDTVANLKEFCVDFVDAFRVKPKTQVVKKPDPLAEYVTAVKDMVGYGVSYYWWTIDPDILADALVVAGCNITHVEFYGYPGDGMADRQAFLYPKFELFVAAMRRRRILTLVNIVGGHNSASPNGYPYAERYGNKWFTDVVDFFYRLGTEGLVVQATAGYGETEACRHSHKRGLAWGDWMAVHWPGRKACCVTRFQLPRQGHISTLYPDRFYDVVPAGYLIVTDGGLDLSEAGKLKEYLQKVRNAGGGFVYCGRNHKEICTATINSIGEIIAEPLPVVKSRVRWP